MIGFSSSHFSKVLTCCIVGLAFVACKGPLEPLSPDEMKEVSIQLVDKIVSGDLPAYRDENTSTKLQPEEILQPAPGSSSLVKPQIVSYTLYTQQELAIANGDLTDTSGKMMTISPKVSIDVNGKQISSNLAFLKIKDVKKAFEDNMGARLIAHIENMYRANPSQHKNHIANQQEQVIISDVYKLLKEGAIAAYEMEDMTRVLSPQELAVHHQKKELIQIPDLDFPNEFVDSIIFSPILADHITMLRPFYMEDGSLLGVTLFYETSEFDLGRQEQRTLPPMPWVFATTEELEEHLTKDRFDILLAIMKDFGE